MGIERGLLFRLIVLFVLVENIDIEGWGYRGHVPPLFRKMCIRSSRRAHFFPACAPSTLRMLSMPMFKSFLLLLVSVIIVVT